MSARLSSLLSSSVAATLLFVLTACASDAEVRGHGAVHLAAPPPGPWELASMVEQQEVPVVRITMAVEAGGQLSGEAGCNRWSGHWELAAQGATLGTMATTRKLCPPAIMEVEQRFLATLARVGGWQMTDAGLMLVDAAQHSLLLFTLAQP